MSGIPKIIHQLWKTDQVPRRWEEAVRSVRRFHPDWEYRLWTDEKMEVHVRNRHPDLYDTFMGFKLNIMRADVFRYILMHDFGGMYCDLDYEFVRPFNYEGEELVLALEYDKAYGDEENQVANFVFASVPQHKLWQDILKDIKLRPPVISGSLDVCIATGPQLVTRIFYSDENGHSGAKLTHQPVFSPRRVHGPYERKFYINSGVTYGFHHGWGSWRDRWNLGYLMLRLAKTLGLGPGPNEQG
jgi:mannosyltransferase OCH1-like enzyme